MNFSGQDCGGDGEWANKPEVAESLEVSTSTKLWSASIVFGMEAIHRDSVVDDSTDDNGVVKDDREEREELCGVGVCECAC